MAGSMVGIADAMRDAPLITGDTYVASLTRRASDLPYMAGSMIGIAEAMRDAPEIAQVIYTQRHSHDALMTSLRPALYGR